MPKWSASSPALNSPRRSKRRMSRRVGAARALRASFMGVAAASHETIRQPSKYIVEKVRMPPPIDLVPKQEFGDEKKWRQRGFQSPRDGCRRGRKERSDDLD